MDLAKPLATDLTDLNTVKGWLGITKDNDDAILQMLISSESQGVADWCSRTFIQQTYTEVRNGLGRNSLHLRNAPITAVTSVTVDTVAVPAAPDSVSFGWVFDDTTVYMQGYQGRGLGGWMGEGIAINMVFNKGIKNISIVYQAGYITPGMVAKALPTVIVPTLPVSIVQAACEIVGLRYKEKDRIGITSQGMPSAGTMSTFMTKAYTPAIMQRLQPFNSVVPNTP